MDVRAAPVWLRLLAGLLDLVPVAALAAAGCRAWFAFHPPHLPPRYWNVLDYAVDVLNRQPRIAAVPLVAFAAAWLAWETAWLRGLGATPIARLAGLRVVTSEGGRVGWGRALARSALSLVLGAAAGIGPAWALPSPRRRMLHDILTGCQVVRGPLP